MMLNGCLHSISAGVSTRHLVPEKIHSRLLDRRCVKQLKNPNCRRVIRVPRCIENDDHYSGAYGSDDMSPDLLAEALDEALGLFNQASMISGIQVKAELEAAFTSEEESSISNSPDLSAPEQLLTFWVEQGLSHVAAMRLLDEMKAMGRFYSRGQLSAKVQRWQRVLPEMDIGSLTAKDPMLLDADVNSALLNMIILVEAFPGKDIMQLLMRQPKVLWTDDLRTRIVRVFDQLQELHPSKDVDVVSEIIYDNPELLFRMDYYAKATLIDELPIEIQNMMILADQGIGYLYRYYNNKRTNYGAELKRNNFNLTEF